MDKHMLQVQKGFRAVDQNTSSNTVKALLSELLKIDVNNITNEKDSTYFIDIVTAQLQFSDNKTMEMKKSLEDLLKLLQDKEMEILNK